MGRLIISEFLSLDGVMEDPGGAEGFKHGGWSFRFPDPEGMAFKLQECLSAEAQLLGRRTYEGFAAAWPQMTDEVGFAAKMNSMPKYVVTSTLADLEWENSHRLEGDLAPAVTQLKADVGGEILVAGSRTLARALLAAGLVDELRLMVFPIVLGSGARLFGPADEPLVLTRRESRTLASGTMLLTYSPAA